MGRRDFNAWNVEELYRELLRTNIGQVPMAAVQGFTSQHKLHPAVNALVGDLAEGNYWAANASGSSYLTVDLGSSQDIDAIRVIPPWWDQRWYKFTVETSDSHSSGYTSRGTKTDVLPLSAKGKLFELSGVTARFVRVTVSDSTDAIARLAGVHVLHNIAEPGADTTYALSWIENDDSGNVTISSGANRVVEQGAFNGDGVIGNSLVTQLSGTGSAIAHHFRGTAESVYLTQGTGGGDASFSVTLDSVSKGTYTVSANTYQVKGYEITGLTSGTHDLRIAQVSGTPQVDYFTGLYDTSYRPIRDDDSAIGYTGSWTLPKTSPIETYTAQRSSESGTDSFTTSRATAYPLSGLRDRLRRRWTYIWTARWTPP